MKLVCLTLLLVVVFGFAQKNEQKPALQSMVDTELAFAKMSLDQGTRPAFMAFIAEDGILFRPRAVKGKQWMIDHPVPPSDKRPLLNWYPIVADISVAGDMGWTTGPWEFKTDIKDAQPVAWGNFLTVWKKQPDGAWKFAIDLGISNPKPDQVLPPWQPRENSVKPARPAAPNKAPEQTVLSVRDSEFANVSVTQGSQAAFSVFAAENVRVFRNNKYPFAGKAAAAAALPDSSNVWNWDPAFADASRSGDLGYTYGTYRILKKDALPTIVESGNYFRVWQKQGGKWLVVADLLDPVAEEKKN